MTILYEFLGMAFDDSINKRDERLPIFLEWAQIGQGNGQDRTDKCDFQVFEKCIRPLFSKDKIHDFRNLKFEKWSFVSNELSSISKSNSLTSKKIEVVNYALNSQSSTYPTEISFVESKEVRKFNIRIEEALTSLSPPVSTSPPPPTVPDEIPDTM